MDAWRGCRLFCRFAALVFVGITAYTVLTKSVDGRLAGDWMHSVLHIGSAAIAAYAGWIARRNGPAVLFTGFLAVVYLALGVVGWFIDGLFLGTPVAIPLGRADNVFHLLVGGSAAAVLAVSAIRRRRPSGSRGTAGAARTGA